MKKVFLTLVVSLAIVSAKAQIYQSKTSLISFFSKTPMEDIKAENKNAQSLINAATGDVVFKVPISGFKFPSALMEEHFHENYMETSKYPSSEFKGKLQEKIDFTKDGTYPATVVGKLTMHGVEQDRTMKGKITVMEGEVLIDCAFDVKLADHKIEIPKLVANNIAEVMPITVKAEYQPYVKK